jgi:hypothetical protein
VGVEVGEDSVVLLEDVEVLSAVGTEDVAVATLPVVVADMVEQSDPLRGDHGRVRPRDVLVEPDREAEAVLLDEVASVGLVPHDHEQGEQLRALLDGEDVRAGRAEQVAEDVAGDAAVPVGAGVVEDEDVRVGGLGKPVGDRAQRARRQRVVPVDEQEVLARGVRHPRVAGLTQADVLIQVDHLDPGIGVGVLVEDLVRAVRRLVIDGDQLEVGEVLVEYRVEAFPQVGPHVVYRDDDAESGGGHAGSSFACRDLGLDGAGTRTMLAANWRRIGRVAVRASRSARRALEVADWLASPVRAGGRGLRSAPAHR